MDTSFSLVFSCIKPESAMPTDAKRKTIMRYLTAYLIKDCLTKLNNVVIY